MKKQFALPAAAVLGGIALLVLRLRQTLLGFEPDTGLTIPDSPYTLAMPAAAAVLAGVLALLARRVPKDGAPLRFQDAFSAPGALPAALTVGGSLLWLTSGVLAVLSALEGPAGAQSVPASGLLLPAAQGLSLRLSLVMGGLTLLSGLCLLAAVFACRSGRSVNGSLLLGPVLFLVVRLVLVYREVSVNPSLSVYYVELLALVFLILGLYQTASFAFANGRTRPFAFCSALAATLCLAALGDRPGYISMAFYGGGGLIMLGLLSSRLGAPARPEELLSAGEAARKPEPPAESED